MKLYEIATAYRNIADLLDNDEFADNADIEIALDKIQDDFKTKGTQIIYLDKQAEGEIELIDGEIKRLQALKKVRQNYRDGLREYLKRNMRESGIFKIESPTIKISYAVRPDSKVELDETAFLDNNLDETLVKVKIEPNKTEIKNRLKKGEPIIGARLVDSEVLTVR